MDPFLQKIHDRPIDGRYTLEKKIGGGGYGVVYLARDVQEENRPVALKLEHHSMYPSALREEARMYEAFEGLEGFPKMYWFGEHDDFRVLAFELLGPSLEDLFVYCRCHFSLKTILLIADQCLVRLRDLHDERVIHRDVKPSNFLMGKGTQGNVVYVTDFGVSEDFILSHAEREDSEEGAVVSQGRLIGTARFASIQGHRGRAQCPRDDLESLGYMLVYLSKGKLPWQGLDHNKEDKGKAVLEMKLVTSPEQLCESMPEEFAQYMHTVKALRNADEPDYEALRLAFRALAAKKGLKYDNVFDWTIRWYFLSGAWKRGETE